MKGVRLMNNLYRLLLENSTAIKEAIGCQSGSCAGISESQLQRFEEITGLSVEVATELISSIPDIEYNKPDQLEPILSSYLVNVKSSRIDEMDIDSLLWTIKAYKKGYLSFLNTFSFEENLLSAYTTKLTDFFEMLELYFTRVWLRSKKFSQVNAAEIDSFIRYQIVVENSLNPIIIVDQDHSIIDMNISARKLYFENNGEYFFQGTIEERLSWLSRHFIQFIKSKARSHSFEQHFDTQKGSRYYDVKLIKTHNSDVRRNEIAVIMNNITGYKKMTKEITDNKQRYHSLFENMFEACCYNKIILDEKRKPVDFIITDVNDALLKTLNLKYEDVVGKSGLRILSFLNEQDWGWLENFGRAALHGSNIRIRELYLESLNKWYSISIYCSEESSFAFVFSDISEKKHAEENVMRLAYYDVLTGLPNSKQLDDKIREAISDSIIFNKQFGVMFIDITNFKKINNTLGHRTGDAMLIQIAGRLKGITGNHDVVAKLGGDKFVILHTNADEETSVVNLANKIIAVLKEPFTFKEHEFFIEVNIGISMFPSDADNMHTLKRNADTAMFIAKNSPGKRYLFHTKDMNEHALRNLILEADLRKALQRNELSLHYQPLVDIENGNIIAFEALLRWMHPTNGPISPAEFIPIAEENGLIVAIGEWVLRAAACKCKEWQINGYDDIYISVNVSIHQLQQEDFIEKVSHILQETELDPKFLRLEITESVYMQHIDKILNTLMQLKHMGLTLSLDDFGTGYSSLNYLNRLPINTLKIDKSFIQNMDSKKDYAILTKAIIKMAHSLNLDVVAEGVETDEELNLLKEHKCDKIQGYLFSKPIPPEAVDDILIIKRNLYHRDLQ